MNERVMQFRIGMFVLVAGLVLIMMIIWFGESPAPFRDQLFIRARFEEAPGVSIGIPVRKSGIRIGEVTAIEFDDRAGQPDGVLVTMAIERRFQLKKGSRPRISRALIGDVSIDMMPGTSPDPLEMAENASSAQLIDGIVAPDPSKALGEASAAFKKVGSTLDAIEEAARGLGGITKKAEALDSFLATWEQTGKNLGAASKRIDDVIAANEQNLKPTIADLREVAKKLNGTLDEQTTSNAKQTLDRLATASAKLDTALDDLRPVLADLGAGVQTVPKTNLGQAVYRMNRIAADVGAVTKHLVDSNGSMNPNGTIQRLITNPALYDNLNKMASSATDVISGLKPAVNSIRVFAEKVSRDPGLLTRGALQR